MSKTKDRIGDLKKKIGMKVVQAGIVTTSFFGVNSSLSAENKSENNVGKKINLTEQTTPTNNKEVNLLLATTEDIAKMIMSQGDNTLDKFELGECKFSKEELEMIKPSEEAEKIVDEAEKIAKAGKPAKGQKTHCLRAVRTVLENSGFDVQAYGHAYAAIEGFKKNDEFVEIKCEAKDFTSVPDGSTIVWGKGQTASGHIEIKNGAKGYCDYVYNLKTNNNRGSTGQKYGDPHVFVQKDAVLSQELVQKLCEAGLLKEETQKQLAAVIMDKQVKDMASVNNGQNDVAYTANNGR